MRRSFSDMWSGTERVSAAVGGGVAVLVTVSVRVAVGGPVELFHYLGAGEVLPPLWLMGLLWLGGFFVIGATVGVLIISPRRCGGREADVWRGCTCLVLSLGAALMWYTLLFGKGSLFFSWLCLPVAIVAGIPGVTAWYRADRHAAVAAGGWILWMALLFLAQFAVMLRN